LTKEKLLISNFCINFIRFIFFEKKKIVTDLVTIKIGHRFGHIIGHIIGHIFNHKFGHRIGHYISTTNKITTNVFGIFN